MKSLRYPITMMNAETSDIVKADSVVCKMSAQKEIMAMYISHWLDESKIANYIFDTNENDDQIAFITMKDGKEYIIGINFEEPV